MNDSYFEYFGQFFSILWTFLLSDVPVLGLPWITLFGGGLIFGVLFTALNHLLGYSSGASFADNIRADNITDRNDSKYESRYRRYRSDQEASYYRHQKELRAYNERKR